MTRDAVHAVAQGRIWSGRKALELHLVDKLGTMDDAIESAATLAGIKEYKVKEYPIFQSPLQKFISDIIEKNNPDESILAKTQLPEMMRIWEVMQSGEPQARLPFGLNITH